MIVNLGIMSIDLPWDIRRDAIELFVIPGASILMNTAFMTAAAIMLITSMPYLGIGPWYPPFIALICISCGLFTYIWDTMSLPWDSKAVELLIILILTASVLTVDIILSPTDFNRFTYIAGLFLAIATWFFLTFGTYIAGLAIPPPNESFLQPGYRFAFTEQVVEGRVKREVYGKTRLEKMHTYWITHLTWSFLFALFSSFFWCQYRTIKPSAVANGTVIELMGIYLACAFFILVLSKIKSREAALTGQRVRTVGGGWRKLNKQFIITSVSLGFVSIIIPPDISPLASENVDSFARNFNHMMDGLTKILFGWVKDDKRFAEGLRTRGRGYGREQIGIDNGGSLAMDMYTLMCIVLALALICLVTYLVIRYIKRVKDGISESKGPIRKGSITKLMQDLLDILPEIFRFPALLAALLSEWLRARLIESVQEENVQSHNAFQRFFSRVKRRLLRLLLPEDPSSIIRALYNRMVTTASEHGIRRLPSMTASEYARYIKSKASTLSHDVTELTDSYTQVRYANRKANRTMAERAIESFRAIRRKIRFGLHRA